MDVKILITGSTGRLGKEITKLFPDALCPTEKELNIINDSSIQAYTSKHKPDVVIHLAAMTSAEECEKNKELAWKVNVEGTENLLKSTIAANPNIYFLYTSTAGVFSGDEGDYNENSKTNPSNYYCQTKLAAEERIKNYKNVCIARSNFVPRGPWPHPKAFTDRYGTYLFASGLAKAIKEIVIARAKGILHITGDKKLSMFELAKITTPNVLPMKLSEYVGPKLPVDLSLRSTRWKTYSLND